MERTEKNHGFLRVWLLLAGFCAAAATVLILCYTYSASLPDNINRNLSAAEEQEIIERNSSMIKYIYLSPNADFPRSEPIRKLTIHHMGENLTLEEAGSIFSQKDRRSSANYGIDSNGDVGLYVEESNRPWSSSSRENDQQAITIEVANDEIGGDWHVSDEAYETLIELCVDICRRNGIKELSFTGDANGNLTLHNMFKSNTECPGPYLKSRMNEIAQTVNRRLNDG